MAALAREIGTEAHTFDQADAVSIDRLASAVGAVDVLVNNAGILIPKSLLEMEPDEIHWLIDTDFVGVALIMRAFGRGMVERMSGVVLQVTRSAAVEWGAPPVSAFWLWHPVVASHV